MKKYVFLCRIVMVIAFAIGPASLGAQTTITEASRNAKYSAVFLYSFTRYFEWKDLDKAQEFKIGLLGADSALLAELNRIGGLKKVASLPIKILQFKSLEEAEQVEVLYVDMAYFPGFKLRSSIKNTLVVTQNNSDIYNTMVAFVTVDDRLKFAFNTKNTEKAGLVYKAEFCQLATAVVGENNRTDDDRRASEKWKNVFEKMAGSLKSNDKEIKLSKNEVQQVVSQLEEQKSTLEFKEKYLDHLSTELSKKEQNLKEQRRKISSQENDIEQQKNKIEEQLRSIVSAEQKIALQEERLKLTVAKNRLQQRELDSKIFEVGNQQKKIAAQRSVLNDQKKDIEKQKQTLVLQLDQINTQKMVLWLSAAIVVIIILALVLVFRSFRKTQRTNALLELQKREISEQNATIRSQKHLVEVQHKEITDSINYAQRIQRSLLADDRLLKAHLHDYFIFFQPKDIVSGDFYWASPLVNGHFAVLVADSTGHGVPGAIMSMLNISCLNEAVGGKQLCEPGQILNHTRARVIAQLANDGSADGGKDGMDCCLLSYDLKNKTLIYSGANNPVWICRLNASTGSHEIIELLPDKMPVGKHDKDHQPFAQQEFFLNTGDMVYAFTDGMPDQFGGPKGKKFMYKRLKDLLIAIAKEPVAAQKAAIETGLRDWKGELEQVDDIAVLGIRIS